jgi:hypothetical protein
MTDQLTPDLVLIQRSNDADEMASVSLRHARAVAVLAAAELAYLNNRNEALADATLRASQDVLEARIALCHALAARGLRPMAEHLVLDELVASMYIGIAGG